MALVCDIKSDDAKAENEDLEDGEIEDDEEEVVVAKPVAVSSPPEIIPPPPQQQIINAGGKFVAAPFAAVDFKQQLQHEKFGPEKTPPQLQQRRAKHDDKKKSHMTEAEKSVMYLHKLERMEREKREKYRREPVDDFASNIEKAIASVLKKDKGFSDEEKDEEKRGKKRKKKDKERRKKQRKLESPMRTEEFDECEMLNMRGGSPDLKMQRDSEESASEESEGSSEHSGGGDRKERRREKREKRNRNRRGDNGKEKKPVEAQMKDSPHLCVYYIQGKCQKGDECPYSHELQPPMKWELCKFYLNDCCAKGDKCLYMHSDFPCKFYHTGQPCLEGENCKFAHGRPLSDRLKQILFKHIETAPKDILGRFPRMGREEAVYKINQTQKTLEVKYGVEKKESNENVNKSNIPSLFDISVPVPMELMQDEKNSDKPTRNRPSRWQDADPMEKVQALQEQRKMQLQMGGFGLKNIGGQDQDMRISSNGDIDMRTLAPLPLQQSQKAPQQSGPGNSGFGLNVLGKQKNDENRPVDIEQYKREAGFTSKMDTDIRSLRGDMDIRAQPPNMEATAKKDVDARQLNFFDETEDVDIRRYSTGLNTNTDNEDEPKLEIVFEDDQDKCASDEGARDVDGRALNEADVPLNLPKRQRELFLRIQAQQKENPLDQQSHHQQEASDTEENNIDWYSDDSNEGRLTIKDDDDLKEKEEEKQTSLSSPLVIKPMEVVEKLGDLSKIDISEEVTKLLSSIRQSNFTSGGSSQNKPRDPRQNRSSPDRAKAAPVDPRRAARSSVEEKPAREQKISIYEQGSFNPETLGKDVDLRSIDKDLDLRPKFDLTSSSSSGRPDIDLRQLSLPFKGIQNYTPATEIDANINSHPPIAWTVQVVEIPKPDYTGLKLSVQEAQTTGDPRLRKIFRLSTDEKESPASPKESPKSTPNPRVDPRRRKMEEAKAETSSAMSYAQQMTMLQGSAFYQNLTSNQKVMLNQELSTRDQSGSPNEQVLAGILAMLGLVPGQAGTPNISGNVLNLLSTIMMSPNVLGQHPNANLLGPNPNMLNSNANMLGQVNPNIIGQNGNLMNQIVQPGLLGAAPGIPNMPPEFQINFDPRNGGLLGNAPPFVNSNFNFNEEYYSEGGGGGGGGGGNNFNTGNRDNRGGFINRDRSNRRGRNFNRNNRNNNFRNRNRSNRSHTPP